MPLVLEKSVLPHQFRFFFDLFKFSDVRARSWMSRIITSPAKVIRIDFTCRRARHIGGFSFLKLRACLPVSCTMATSIAAPAAPGAQITPSIPQGAWGGSPAVQSPGLPAHQQGPGVGSDAALFASRPETSQHPKGVAQPHSMAPSPQTVAPTCPPAGPPTQGSSSNAPGINSTVPPAPVRSDTGPGAQSTTHDKSHTEQYTAIATVIQTAERSVLRQVIRDHWDLAIMGSDYNIAFFVRSSSRSSISPFTWAASSSSSSSSSVARLL